MLIFNNFFLKKFKIFLLIILLLISFGFYLIYKKNKNIEKSYIVLENNIKFFKSDENQKIIKIKPILNDQQNKKKIEDYEIYKLKKNK